MKRGHGRDKARLFVVDDDRTIRQALTDILASASFDVVAFPTAQELLAALDGGNSAECVISDVRMPEMSGLDLLNTLARRQMDVPVVLITGHADVPMAVHAMKAGAADFIEKPFSVEEILRAVTTATQSGQNGAETEDRAELEQRFQSLTPRERETLNLIVLGHTNRSAASQLSISHRTVEVHRAKIMEKMMATSLADLVRMSMQLSR